MTREQSVLLTLIRSAIHGADVASLPEDIDWAALIDLATRQGVGAIAADGLQRLYNAHPEWELSLDRPENESMKYDWFGQVFYAEESYAKYQHALAGLAKFYNEHGFKMMVLKGYGCSLNYPVPEHRPCGDIDIWQFGHYKEADAALSREKGIKVDRSHHHHTVFYWKGQMVENHYDFVNQYSHRTHRKMEAIFKRLAEDESNTINLLGQVIYFPSPNLHAFFLVRHASKHFADDGILLRHILDWALFVRVNGAQVDWPWLQDTVSKFGMNEIFRCFNAICVEDLGFSAAFFPQDTLPAPPIKYRVFAEILSPEFHDELPSNLLAQFFFKLRRWKSNGWKRKIAYPESDLSAIAGLVRVRLVKPSRV